MLAINLSSLSIAMVLYARYIMVLLCVRIDLSFLRSLAMSSHPLARGVSCANFSKFPFNSFFPIEFNY